MSGEEVARELITTLSIHYSVSSNSLLATMRDCASVNDVTLRTLKVIYPAFLDVGYFSHTLDLVGNKFCTHHLTDFSMAWVSLFSHSPKARLVWREQTGRSVTGYSPTRWWSRWEVMKQLLELFGDVEAFLTMHDQAPATRHKLLQFLQDPQKKAFLEVELAIIVDAGMPFVQATYKLEGDGHLALECNEVKEMIPDCSAVDCLSAFPFLDGATLGNLKTELPKYIAAAEDVNLSYSPLEFWKVHEPSLSAWSAAAKKVLLVQPSSAACERFSLS